MAGSGTSMKTTLSSFPTELVALDIPGATRDTPKYNMISNTFFCYWHRARGTVPKMTEVGHFMATYLWN